MPIRLSSTIISPGVKICLKIKLCRRAGQGCQKWRIRPPAKSSISRRKSSTASAICEFIGNIINKRRWTIIKRSLRCDPGLINRRHLKRGDRNGTVTDEGDADVSSDACDDVPINSQIAETVELLCFDIEDWPAAEGATAGNLGSRGNRA